MSTVTPSTNANGNPSSETLPLQTPGGYLVNVPGSGVLGNHAGNVGNALTDPTSAAAATLKTASVKAGTSNRVI